MAAGVCADAESFSHAIRLRGQVCAETRDALGSRLWTLFAFSPLCARMAVGRFPEYGPGAVQCLGFGGREAGGGAAGVIS